MAQETIDTPQNRIAAAGDRTLAVEPALARSSSFSRLNAGAPEFSPRAVAAPAEPSPPVIHVFHLPPPPPTPPFFAPVSRHGSFEYYGGGSGGGFGEHDVAREPAELEPVPPATDGLPKEVVQKIIKQVEYYFSDANLATTEHLMRFISKDPEGYVPISVIASFKKIKALVHNNSLLATALRTSSKLVVSDDGKKVRRRQPFTESDVEELQSRIVVAENLPEDHCYRNLMKIFSAVGNVRTIRTCYPQTPNDTVAPANRSWKIDVLFHNKLHAFVEYQSIEDAKKAVTELNEERNWRSGLKVRLLSRCMTQHGSDRGRKVGHEDWTGDEDDAPTTNPPSEKQMEDPSQPSEILLEHVGEESFNKEGGVRHGRGRGRGGRGRGRGQYYHNNNRNGAYAIGNPPSSHLIHVEHQQQAATKPPPGPRMPDGTRGFTIGRGKPLAPINIE